MASEAKKADLDRHSSMDKDASHAPHAAPQDGGRADGATVSIKALQDSDAQEAEPRRTAKKGALKGKALIFASGGALFSDGYINANSGPTNTILSTIYANEPRLDNFSSLYSSLAFAGTLVGILVFSWLSDRIGRRFGMLFGCVTLSISSVLIAGAWGAGGSIGGLFAALEAWRFIQGVAIGSEYPASTTASAENTEARDVNPKYQQSLLILSTNTAIDIGFIAAPLVAFILYNIFGDAHLEWVWRLTLGLGAIPPAVLLLFRMRMEEPEAYRKHSIRKARLPWGLILRHYWLPVVALSFSWFAYDWSSYPSSIYSSYFIQRLIPSGDLYRSLGWSVAINAFYLPGTIIGAFVSDRLGPRKTMVLGLAIQSAFGFGLAGGFHGLRDNIGAVVALYGLFAAFGEFGPGNNLGLLAAKGLAPTAIRSRLYGVAALVGKVGSFTGSYAFTRIQKSLAPSGQSDDLYFAGPFYIGASLAIASALVTWLFVPDVGRDHMRRMDEEFEKLLEANGYDMSGVGLDEDSSTVESRGATTTMGAHATDETQVKA